INPMLAKADGSEVEATAVLTTNGRPIAGETITFSAELDGVVFSKSGGRTSTEVTDAMGVATAKFFSNASTGDCMISAVTVDYVCPGTESSRPSADETMVFEPEDYSIELTATSDGAFSDGSSAAADGLTRVTLKAVLKNKNDLPVEGAPVTFGCENGCIERCGSPIITDGQGVATTKMTTSVMLWDDPTNPDSNVSIWADYAVGEATHREAISFRFRKIGIKSVSALDYSILEDGSEETILSAAVEDSDGYPVIGVAVEMTSNYGIFTSSGTNTITYATDNKGRVSERLKGHCLNGKSFESARIAQEYCDFCDQAGQTPPVVWKTEHVMFERGGPGCYELAFNVTPVDVCVKVDPGATEDDEDTVTDQCFADVWVQLRNKSDGTPIAGKNVTVWIDNFSNPTAIAYFNDDTGTQWIGEATDSDGYVHLSLDATGGGRALLRARSDEFGGISTNISVNFGAQFCVRISPTAGSLMEGEAATFTAWGGCSKTYHWFIDDVLYGTATGEYETFLGTFGTEGTYIVKVCDDLDDCATATVFVKAEEEEEEEEEAPPEE
ncbi:Ig-like domain-containing protein, partial [bacterium]|nr:Ig-like domain-containing protein [bacterium]